MGNIISGIFGHDTQTQMLLLAWADHHPYLFTLIQVAAPINWVVVSIVGMKVISTMVGARNARR